MIEFKVPAGTKLLELGCGQRRHPAATVAVDVRFIEGVTDFVVNFDEPNWPITSEEFDVIYSCFVLEHISWRNTLNFLKECFRILRPGGKLVLVTPDTEAQLKYVLNKQDWDNAGCVLFGDLDYPENSHRAFVNPVKMTQWLREVGFSDVLITPYGETQTDMVTQALKPVSPVVEGYNLLEKIQKGEPLTPNVLGSNVENTSTPPEPEPQPEPPPLPPASVLFDRRYFDGGNEWGGFQQGYRDFACHEVTAQHVLARNPESVLELGCARGYVLKRLEDAGIRCYGIDPSKHCHLTRVSEGVQSERVLEDRDILGLHFDLCFSIATLDHIAEKDLPVVIERMRLRCKRGLHGINFSPPGGDRTRQTCKPRDWWVKLFEKHAPNWPVEILDKDELENGNLPPTYLAGDGKVKIQFGSYTTMFYHGWLNTDIIDLSQWAQQNHYKFKQLDVREGLPFDTESVDAIYTCHHLEHLTYAEGLAFLKECRRILKPDGAMRIIVPNAELWNHSDPSEFDELSGTVATSKTPTRKVYELLHANHHSLYDYETLALMLQEAGLQPYRSWFRKSALVDGRGASMQAQILRETLDVLESVSLFVEAYVPHD